MRALIDAAESMVLRMDIALDECNTRYRALRDHDCVRQMLGFLSRRVPSITAYSRSEGNARGWVASVERDERANLLLRYAQKMAACARSLRTVDDGRRAEGQLRHGGEEKDVVYAVFGQQTRHLRGVPIARGDPNHDPAPDRVVHGGRSVALRLCSLERHTAASLAELAAKTAGEPSGARLEVLHQLRVVPAYRTLCDAAIGHGATVFVERVPPPHPRPRRRRSDGTFAGPMRPASADHFRTLRHHAVFEDMTPGERCALVAGAASSELLQELKEEKLRTWRKELPPVVAKGRWAPSPAAATVLSAAEITFVAHSLLSAER